MDAMSVTAVNPEKFKQAVESMPGVMDVQHGSALTMLHARAG